MKIKRDRVAFLLISAACLALSMLYGQDRQAAALIPEEPVAAELPAAEEVPHASKDPIADFLRGNWSVLKNAEDRELAAQYFDGGDWMYTLLDLDGDGEEELFLRWEESRPTFRLKRELEPQMVQEWQPAFLPTPVLAAQDSDASVWLENCTIVGEGKRLLFSVRNRSGDLMQELEVEVSEFRDRPTGDWDLVQMKDLNGDGAVDLQITLDWPERMYAAYLWQEDSDQFEEAPEFKKIIFPYIFENRLYGAEWSDFYSDEEGKPLRQTIFRYDYQPGVGYIPEARVERVRTFEGWPIKDIFYSVSYRDGSWQDRVQLVENSAQWAAWQPVLEHYE